MDRICSRDGRGETKNLAQHITPQLDVMKGPLGTYPEVDVWVRCIWNQKAYYCTELWCDDDIYDLCVDVDYFPQPPNTTIVDYGFTWDDWESALCVLSCYLDAKQIDDYWEISDE